MIAAQTLLQNLAQEHRHIKPALASLDEEYLRELSQTSWLPGWENAFKALTASPPESCRYILLGESPYPRQGSANGYAFWDGAVDSLWSETGFSKSVNRATSLRNFLKMLLHTEGLLHEDLSQEAISAVDKSGLHQTAKSFFEGMMQKGFMLLNASLVFEEGRVAYHAKHWQPFMESLFANFAAQANPPELILWGNIAKKVNPCGLKTALCSEHPYNISFIHNPDVQAFFKPLRLLRVKNDDSQSG